MIRPGLCISLMCALLLTAPHGSNAQITGEAVVLSPRVGEVIDSTEREHFHIFPQIKGFRSARLLITRDSVFYIAFEIVDAGSLPRIDFQRYSERVLQIIAEKINHFEEVTAQDYVFGSDPVVLQTVSGRRVTQRRPSPPDARPAVSDVTLPFAASSSSFPIDMQYPQFGFSCGVALSELDAGDVVRLLQATEQFYRQYGYPIGSSALDTSPESGLAFTATLVFSPEIDVSLEVFRQRGIVERKSTGLIVRYFPPELDFGAGRCFGLAGLRVEWYGMSLAQPYGNRIGPIDSLGRYMMFASVGVRGSQRRVSGVLGIGIELGHTATFRPGLAAFARYHWSPDVQVVSGHGNGVIRIRGFTFGVSLALYFE